MLYLSGGGVLAERFAGSGGTVQWTTYLFAAGQLIGVFVEKSDETVATRYFHMDHLGSVSVITDENGVVLERLSYDAWGLRRNPDGSPDPAGAITSEATRGCTGHHLAEVGLIHMSGRVALGFAAPRTGCGSFLRQNWRALAPLATGASHLSASNAVPLRRISTG